jgi:TonB family protein
MVVAYAQGLRSTQDERSARQVALLVAVAAHLFLFVWLLRNFHADAPVAAEAPAFVLVDVYRTPKHAPPPPIRATRTHGRSAATTNSNPGAPPLAESRLAVVEGTEAVGAPTTRVGAAETRSGRFEGGSNITSGNLPMPAFHAPRVLRRAPTVYPADAYASRSEGETEVLVTIGSDGRLVDARVSHSSGSESLDRATLEAVRKYQFRAADRDGTPVEAQAYLVVAWQISAAIAYEFNKRLLPSGDREEQEALAEERSVYWRTGTTGLDNHGKDQLDSRTAKPIEKQQH